MASSSIFIEALGHVFALFSHGRSHMWIQCTVTSARVAIARSRSLVACLALAPFLIGASNAAAAIVVDGKIDEAEWQEAALCTNWRRTEPFALDEPRYRNDVRILATPEGLAAAFTIDHPRSEPRVKPSTPRDADRLTGDSVGLMVDFDATGQIGYEFSVGLGGGVRDGLITNQNLFDRDWDGSWKHAVLETEEQWFVEILVPWETVSMRGSTAEHRTVGIYANRYLFNRNERYACPGISDEASAFLSDLQHIDISQYRAEAALDFVPYATVIFDQLHDDTEFKAGADLLWKPSPSLWLAATLNPDFGQVESDELVVNFSAIETVYTDKRPFFTENQGIFDLRTPSDGQLIYTRRVGAAPDDLSTGSTDIDVALKLTGTAKSVSYGAFVAQERDHEDDVGRLFTATRLAVPFEKARVGHLATWTDRPLLDRQALVNAFDYEWTPGDWWRFAGQVIRSDIDANGSETNGYEAWAQADMNRSSPLTHTLKLLYADDEFDLNDLGYMERNSLRQAEWETNRRVAAGKTGARVSGETQRLYLVYRENDDGDRLQSRVQISRDVQYASAWRAYEELRYVPAGVDDLISRGNGPVELDSRVGAYFDLTSPRRGAWQYILGSYLFQQGVDDYSLWLQTAVSWYPHQTLTLRLDLLGEWSEDWLLWERDNLFGSYRSKRLDLDFRLDWIPSPRHELRIKWQWIGIDASVRDAYRTDPAGNLRVVNESLRPFTVSNLGLQLRYRFELAPMSELFLVYARGGFAMESDDERDIGTLFRDQGEVRDADQFLIKFRYRL